MRILVTGGTGFIGSHIVRQLMARPKFDLFVLTRSTSDLWRLNYYCPPQLGQVRIVHGDLCNGEELSELISRIRPEVLIHLAQAYQTLGSPSNPFVEELNLNSAVRLQEAFLKAGGRRFVAAGSCFEYGNQDCELIDEDTVCQPLYEYAVAKSKATHAIISRGTRTNEETVVLRVFSPYGPLEKENRIVPQLFASGLTSSRIPITAGEQVRDYVYVEDVATAFVKVALAQHLPRRQAVYNVCTGTPKSVRQLAKDVERLCGRPLDLGWGTLPYRPNEMMRLVGSNRRIAADLHWRPITSLSEGLYRTLQWWEALHCGTPTQMCGAPISKQAYLERN
jgi:nucleoside-diphosphate-sugar epimerase